MRQLILTLLAILNMSVADPNPALVRIPINLPMTLYTVYGRPVTYVVCDKAMAKPLIAAFKCLGKLDKPVEIVYHGCHAYRKIAGTERWSEHAYGRAIDLNAYIGMPDRMIRCFLDTGYFIHGGDWPGSKKDPMHMELKTDVN